ncbi:unnamed protein product, partial [Ectocarpus sp. 12 AP-2014]
MNDGDSYSVLTRETARHKNRTHMYPLFFLCKQTTTGSGTRALNQSRLLHHSSFIIADDLVALALVPIGSRMALAILLNVHRLRLVARSPFLLATTEST